MPTPIRSVLRPLRLPGIAVPILAIVLAACGGGGTSTEPSPTTPAATAASATPMNSQEPSEAASPSAAAAPCLPAEVIAAINQLAEGNFEPDVPLDEIADIVAELDVSGLDDPSFAELLRDDLVEKLGSPDDVGGIGRAAAGFVSEVLPELEEC